MSACMIAFHRAHHLQHLALPLIGRHREQCAVIKSLIAKTYDLRMATIVLTQQRGGRISENLDARLQKTALHRVVTVPHRIIRAHRPVGQRICLTHHIGQLLAVAHDHRIHGARQRQSPGFDVHLRSLVHDHIVKHVIRMNVRVRLVRTAQHHRIFLQKRFGIRLDAAHGKLPTGASAETLGHLVSEHLPRRSGKCFERHLQLQRLQALFAHRQFMLYLRLTHTIESLLQTGDHLHSLSFEEREQAKAEHQSPFQAHPRPHLFSLLHT